jgi:hypothetical protein
VADACQAGSCISGAPVVCSALDPCHDAGICAPATGLCSNPAKADGTLCGSGMTCTAGVCEAPPTHIRLALPPPRGRDHPGLPSEGHFSV